MPRFSIRDLLWLTLVVGLVVGWWLDRERLADYAEDARRSEIRSAQEARRQAEVAAQQARQAEIAAALRAARRGAATDTVP